MHLYLDHAFPGERQFVEDFTDTTLRDDALTDANWSTTEQALLLAWLALTIGSLVHARRWAIVYAGLLPLILYLSLAKHEAQTNSLFFTIYLGALAPLLAY